MTDKQANDAAEAMFWTIAMYQKGVRSHKKREPRLRIKRSI